MDSEPLNSMRPLKLALKELGSLPSVTLEPDGTVRINLSNCVFLELAREYPDVVCEAHRALFQVVADAMGDYEAFQETCMAKGADFCLTILRKRRNLVAKGRSAGDPFLISGD